MLDLVLPFELADSLRCRVSIHPRHFHIHKTNIKSRFVAGRGL